MAVVSPLGVVPDSAETERLPITRSLLEAVVDAALRESWEPGMALCIIMACADSYAALLVERHARPSEKYWGPS